MVGLGAWVDLNYRLALIRIEVVGHGPGDTRSMTFSLTLRKSSLTASAGECVPASKAWKRVDFSNMKDAKD
jgi:hypothetical protein